MNLKHMTVLLIAVLIYEVVLKLTHVLLPSLHEISLVASVTAGLRYVTGVILVAFIYLFYMAEKEYGGIRQVAGLIMIFVALNVILRLLVTRGTGDHASIRVVSQLAGLSISVLFFMLVVVYRRNVPLAQKPLRCAALLVAVTFGIGIGTSLVKSIEITRFAVHGEMTDHSPLFFNLMFVLFLVTHAAVIYFLYRYYQFKFGRSGPNNRLQATGLQPR